MIYFTSLNEDNYISDNDNIILSNIDLLSEVTLMFINESSDNKSILTRLKDFVKRIIEKLKAWFRDLLTKKPKPKCDVSNINDIEKQYYDSEKPSSKFSEEEKMDMYKNTMKKYTIRPEISAPIISIDMPFDFEMRDISIEKRKNDLTFKINRTLRKNNFSKIEDISKISDINVYIIGIIGERNFSPINPTADFKKISDIIKKYDKDIQYITNIIDNDIKNIERTYKLYIEKLEKKREIYNNNPEYLIHKINLSLELMSLDTKTFIEYYNRIITIYNQEINKLYVLQNKIIKTSQYFGLEYK